jgi:TolB protein
MNSNISSWLSVAVLMSLALSLPMRRSYGQQVGPFDHHADVGKPKIAGSAAWDEATQQLTLSGAGSNMWLDHDEFQFAWKKMKGDFIVRASVKFLGDGVDPHRKLGWMVRSSLEPDSPYVDVALHGSGLVSMQYRRTTGGQTEETYGPINGPAVLQLARHGNHYTMSVAWSGDTFAGDRQVEIDLGEEVCVGLFVCAHNPDVVEQAVFNNVRIVVPAADDFKPYQDYIGSNIEILDLATGNRKIIYRSPKSLQAPNWTTDGKALIYSSEGRLYCFDLATLTPTVIDTGKATNNNNDHVLSFDGSQLGISNHSPDDDNQSIIFTLPATGGTPQRVTRIGPSYLHGWSPDASELVYTGGRDPSSASGSSDGQYDIYKIPAGGGEEVQLTNQPSLDDGPEYTPDGQFIYFNSARSGRMQIWRMHDDGSDQEQVTDDELNNWFPHISPDGKWIVFISFQSDVDPEDHPFYKQVYLRRMPRAGGKPEVIAYVYGGQGTMNVPSWSPDGKQLAFISNTADN